MLHISHFFLLVFLVFQKFFITFAETKRKTMGLLIRRHTHPLLAHWLRKGLRMGLLNRIGGGIFSSVKYSQDSHHTSHFIRSIATTSMLCMALLCTALFASDTQKGRFLLCTRFLSQLIQQQSQSNPYGAMFYHLTSNISKNHRRILIVSGSHLPVSISSSVLYGSR